MKRLWQDRSIFFQLLGGALAILLVFSISWLLINEHFFHELDRTNTRRWATQSIDSYMEQARQYEGEGDFAAQNGTQEQFYTTGDSPMLQDHRAAISQLLQQVDTLIAWHDESHQQVAPHLRDAVLTYAATFDTLVQMYRQQGRGRYGLEGQWILAVDTIQRRTRAASEELGRYGTRLDDAQRDYLLNHDSASAAAISATTAVLLRAGGDVTGLTPAVMHSDSLFRAYVAIRSKIGQTEKDGLLGRLFQSVQLVETDVDDLLTDAIRDNDTARRHFAIMTPLVFIVELVLAALFFFVFAKSISKTTEQLGNAATAIGNGQFDARVDVKGKNELGRLAEQFNRMAESLAVLVSSVRQSGLQINSSAMEIAATAREQQATASEIANTTAKVGTTAHEISTRSQELAHTVTEVAGVAERTATLAGSGQTGISRMEATMRQISDASASISTRLATLSEKAGNINTVVTTITKVADQTNLLSLNAAIEAEKAGEYGRGFSVVATEIRRLADQTAAATSDIEQIVKEMQSAVTAGVMGMDKFTEEVRRGVEASNQVGEQLSEIIQQVQTLTPNFEVVNDGMQLQAEGAQQISQALVQLGAAAQQTAESLLQSNQAIDQLNEASRGLQSGVSRFTVKA